MNFQPTERRLFITEDSKEFFKLFTVKQGSEDADIYFSWPNSRDSKFLLLDKSKPEWQFRAPTAMNDGRLSFHDSGQVHFAEYGMKAREEFVIKGNQLFNTEKREIGMRHLFTGFLTKPSEKAPDTSPAFNRKSDDSFLTKDLSPAIIIFFAVPNGYSIGLEMKLHTDYFNVPEHLPGVGTFQLKHHNIFWVAYQQIHLSWPKHNHIAYSDGFSVPLFIGKENNTIDLSFIEPSFKLEGQSLTIQLHQFNSK